MMKTVLLTTALALSLTLGGCGEEPERIVSAETTDGRWELTLEARKNLLRPGEKLAVRVTLESLVGQPTETFWDTIDFLSNAGSVSPARLVFSFIGSQDTTYRRWLGDRWRNPPPYTGEGNTTLFGDWVTYTMAGKGTQANESRQGEISALFRDLEAVLKIRVIED